MTAGSPRELEAVRVLVTRERPGELALLLEARGAEVVHMPLIAVTDPPDGGLALRTELERVTDYDWVIVTSAPGAERVGAAVRAAPDVSTAAVGSSTARRLAELTGRPVDLVPHRQLAAELADLLIDRCPQPARMLVAQADRARPELTDRLISAGHRVSSVVAYSTELVEPDVPVARSADVLVLASGSAATAWAEALGSLRPPLVVAIGPTTASAARQVGLKVDGVAADHSLDGLVDEVVRCVVRDRAHDQT